MMLHREYGMSIEELGSCRMQKHVIVISPLSASPKKASSLTLDLVHPHRLGEMRCEIFSR